MNGERTTGPLVVAFDSTTPFEVVTVSGLQKLKVKGTHSKVGTGFFSVNSFVDGETALTPGTLTVEDNSDPSNWVAMFDPPASGATRSYIAILIVGGMSKSAVKDYTSP